MAYTPFYAVSLPDFSGFYPDIRRISLVILSMPAAAFPLNCTKYSCSNLFIHQMIQSGELTVLICAGFLKLRCSFVDTLASLLYMIHVPLLRCCDDDLLSISSCIKHFQRDYATTRLPESLRLFLFYYHLFNLFFPLKDDSGSPELPILPNPTLKYAILYTPEAVL